MIDRLTMTREEILEKIASQIKQKFTGELAKNVAEFAQQFYSTVSLEDLNERDIADLYGAVLSHWSFIHRREPAECKVRVYNPNFEQHGWQSTHTIIEVSQRDMPFLVDSLRMGINRHGMGIHLMIHIGGLKFQRDDKSTIEKVLPTDASAGYNNQEAFIYIEVDRQTDHNVLEGLREQLLDVLTSVRMSVEDWKQMRQQVEEVLVKWEKEPPPVDPAELAEAKEFLHWLGMDNFTFLGCRDYEIVGEGTEMALRIVPGTGYGVLRETGKSESSRLIASLPPAAQGLAFSPDLLVLSKTNTRSTIHRSAYCDYIGIKWLDKQGKVLGERRLIGLYTSSAYNSSLDQNPIGRRKKEAVLQMSRLPTVGHAYKDLVNILETLPRDIVFQATVSDLFELATGILHLQERQRIRLFVWKDVFGRFVSCLVYLPREQMNTELRQAMQDILQEAFGAIEISFVTRFTESILAQVHFAMRLDPHRPLHYEVKALEAKLVEVARSWQDDLKRSLVEYYGEERGMALLHKYEKAFPAGYREDFSPRVTVFDIEHIECLSSEQRLSLSFYRSLDDPENILRFKLFQLHHPAPLSDVLPILENMGAKVIGERPHEIILKDRSVVWINDFSMEIGQHVPEDVEAVKDLFQEAFRYVWYGDCENDSFNRLVLSAQLNWREVAILRAYAKYLKQIGFTFSQAYIEQTLANNAAIAKKLIDLFHLRFDPTIIDKADAAVDEWVTQIQHDLDGVVSLDEDRILRRYLELMRATTRTNYFQIDAQGRMKPYLSFKVNPNIITDIPLPRPMFEIFVYSPRFEGIHLRNAKVARGGIRWSDRREDFRTEILGLMKAQRVKNAVIVPSGAKGGFIPKCLLLDGNRESVMEEGIACYKNFIRGLLDITDNLRGTQIIVPDNVARYDEDDPYLVVAADKGTATFSDIANSISKEYNFWLGDAFASGGSAGYDHKKMGITARGAWESVKRHFRELGIDTQTIDFTVVGIGDMSGDVFGNGMLLSRHIKLVGAFNHMHIFLDPFPDPEVSFRERERLFHLPRSSWEDYNPELISTGGGVFKRSAKSIKLSPEVQALLGLNKEYVVPNELIRALLMASVDLLWNGGIGTYVKATYERSSEVGDRANDAIRINGNELRCRVVGEGGNLGFTQLGRVEYALNGGNIYTDFIDNSAGVNCSDFEVNIKILLNDVIANGDMTEKQRNQLLVEMTDEVATLVLRNNYLQTQAISIATVSALKYAELHRYYIRELESQGKIDREIEFLPDDKTIVERRTKNKGLTNPEIAVLFAYTKSLLKEEILKTDVPEDPHLSVMLETAFPKVLSERFRSYMIQHKLRREIIATQLSNIIINEMGIAFIYRLYDETGSEVSAIVRAYYVARNIFALPELWSEIEALDLKIPASIQFTMMAEVERLVRRATRWFLRHRRIHLDIASTVERFGTGVVDLMEQLPKIVVGATQQKLQVATQQLLDAGVPKSLVMRIATARIMFSALDIIEASIEHNFNLGEVASVYHALNERLELGWFREQITEYPVETHWDALAREAIRDDLDLQHRDLSIGVLKTKLKGKDKDITTLLDLWSERHQSLVTRWHTMLADLRSSGSLNFTKFSVAVRELLDLTQTSFHAARANDKNAKK